VNCIIWGVNRGVVFVPGHASEGLPFFESYPEVVKLCKTSSFEVV